MSPATVQTLQVGDLVTFGSVPRKVRRISKSPPRSTCPRRVYSVTFAKIARSRYPSPTTIYYDHELHAKHIKLVRRGVRLRTTKCERLLQQTIDEGRNGNDCLISQDLTVGTVT